MRRLRENTMLNTEIGKTGEVIVEGHVIGRLDGFMFAPDAAEAGSEAKALQATAQKALAGEIDARAEKLSQAPDDQFVLASDGTIRWTGDAVAKVVAGDDALHPRIRIVADERLSGAPRDAVQARLDLWLKTHAEKLLGPLFELVKAEDVTGIARGIAFQLTEALGVLERSKIANEVKDLDQASRATLRKYGVRFGAYHLYVPALLKPAARALASQLWAHKQDNVDLSALLGAQHLAGSGRTSFPVDKALDRDAYRVLGYRQCGERAVRVDILERLADLIRPALAWREASGLSKPAGAFDGRGFVVTQAMTSLTGSAGEDFASILRALGYRMELRPAPAPEVVPETVVADAAVVADPASAEIASTDDAPPADDVAVVAASDAASSDDALPPSDGEQLVEAQASEPARSDDAPSEAWSDSPGAVEAAPAIASEPVVANDTATEALSESPATDVAEAAPVEAAAEAATTDAPPIEAASTEAAAPAMVEVWRPGGRSEDRRPRHDRHRHRQPNRPQDGAQGVAAEGETKDGDKRQGHRRRDRSFDFKRPNRPAGEAGATSEATSGEGRPPRERSHGKDARKDFGKGRDKGKFQGKGGRDRRPDGGGPSHRPFASSAPRERERDRPADPNSPFAKLAALKEQLAANRKDAN
jgi:ATP-dependent RNA helicase SUPV3L1/SUV3